MLGGRPCKGSSGKNCSCSLSERADLQHHRLTNAIHLTLRVTTAQVVKTSVTNNSAFPLPGRSHQSNYIQVR